jgi:hypothetical protein
MALGSHTDPLIKSPLRIKRGNARVPERKKQGASLK